jgi:cytochrome c-type biogenesis protein CcmH/NrfG
LLWASAGLLAVVLMLRLVFGPGHARTSQSVVVRVPDAPTEPVASAPVAGLSERGLIGGNLNQQVYTRVEAQVRTSVTSEPVVQPVAVAAVAPASADHPAPGVASGRRAVDEPNEPDEPQATDAANGARPAVPTVSAAQVGRSLARAAQTRASGAAEVDYKVRGRELYQAGKFREAAEAYQRATERNGSDAGAYAGMGASFLAAGDAGRAVTAYKRAVQIEPAVSGFQAALGRAYLKKGDRTQARAAYAKALTLDPNNQAAKTGMASAKVR